MGTLKLRALEVSPTYNTRSFSFLKKRGEPIQ